MAMQHQPNQSFLLDDALYCEEEHWEEDEEEEVLDESNNNNKNINGNTKYHHPFSLPLVLLEQDMFWEDEELISLFTKEKQTHPNFEPDPSLSLARTEAVEWMLKVNSYYGFAALTAILAINYLDRFLCTLPLQRDKPWMIQLAAVTCLSLAAKVEETQVPLLLDFQVEDSKFVFEAKTIQRMEVLVLSSLQWRMNPVTPLSFLDHIIRRLGLKTHLHWEFLRRCEALLLTLVSDPRFVHYLPSVLATATMFHVIHQVETCDPVEYQNQLLGVLKISKEKVNDCYQLIVELSNTGFHGQNKRKYSSIPSSPNGVIGATFSSDCSNDSWAVANSSVSSSPEPLLKKNRGQEMHRVFVDVTAGSSPR